MPEQQALTPSGLAEIKAELEKIELESSGGGDSGLSCEQCLRLLALKLYFNDVVDCKFFWKRIRPAFKESNTELGKLWQVGQALVNKRTTEALKLLESHKWSQPIEQIIEFLQEKVKDRSLELVGKAYTSISVQDLSEKLNMSLEQTVTLAAERKWQVDTASGMVSIPLHHDGPVVDGESVSLASLTRLVSCLEN